MNGHAAQDAKLERVIRTILKIGVAASGAFLAVGLVWSLTATGSATAAMLMTIGLMILMATPISRVAASVVEYTVQRDWPFVLLTRIVLLEIVASVIAALVFHRRL